MSVSSLAVNQFTLMNCGRLLSAEKQSYYGWPNGVAWSVDESTLLNKGVQFASTGAPNYINVQIVSAWLCAADNSIPSVDITTSFNHAIQLQLAKNTSPMFSVKIDLSTYDAKYSAFSNRIKIVRVLSNYSNPKIMSNNAEPILEVDVETVQELVVNADTIEVEVETVQELVVDADTVEHKVLHDIIPAPI